MRAYVCDLNKKLHQFQDGWYDPVIFNKFEMEQMIIVQNVSGSYQVLWSQLINFELATYCSDPEASLAFSSIIWQPGPESESVFCNLPTGSHTGAWVRGWKMTNNKHTVKKRKHIIIWRDCTSARSKYGLFGCPRGSNWQGRGIYQLKLLLLPSCQKKKKKTIIELVVWLLSLKFACFQLIAVHPTLRRARNTAVSFNLEKHFPPTYRTCPLEQVNNKVNTIFRQEALL